MEKDELLLHCTAGPKSQTAQDVDNYHKNAKDADGNFIYHNGAPSSLGYYIGYHDLVEYYGDVTHAREYTELGAHAKGYNEHIGIGMVGNFDVELPSQDQVYEVKKIINSLVSDSTDKQMVYPHRHVTDKKTCYGSLLHDKWGESLRGKHHRVIKINVLVPDMQLGKKGESLVKNYIYNTCGDIGKNSYNTITVNFNFKKLSYSEFYGMLEDMGSLWIGKKPSPSFYMKHLFPHSGFTYNATVLCFDSPKWNDINLNGLLAGYDFHGHRFICQKLGLYETRKNGDGWQGDVLFPGTLRHELTHLISSFVGGIDHTHEYDYEHGGAFDKLYARHIPSSDMVVPNFSDVLFKVMPKHTLKPADELSFIPEDGRLYCSPTQEHGFIFKDWKWSVLTSDDYDGLLKKGTAKTIMSQKETNRVLIDMGKDPALYAVEHTVIKRPRNELQRFFWESIMGFKKVV